MIFSAPVTVAWSGVECNFLSSKWEGSYVKPEWHYIRSKHISNYVCINIYLKLGDLGHMLVSVLKKSSDETYDNVNDDIQNWAVET